ncbi:ABC transporter substrate binding protein [Desulfotomaculum nigrificans CO-1-SRB]|uniref:ABC transporter substrate binding protein n=1 Tax=Desulfotomaculum nigrificans (strain DSM 14880 / VKM B-2319 / CO-1-SRB) TaxID=868595 RepID=F6B8H3_DESCC|nr:ABC transporter substrate-binding protein [Desulfotomaculum nigrificans]AEF93545.1 ABC transporter substrate binding protein [Desulfotomaculum nigrificans CO-1-SRB]
MKKLVLTLLGLLLVLGLTGCGGGDQPAKSQNQDQVKLGIIQIVQHPSLDAARQGFLDVLKENGYVDGQKLAVDYQNAQGDQANLQTIARKFVQDKCDLVLAVATPSAMTMANETTEIPILITAVTDPVSAKLVKSLSKPGTNVTGTTDMNPVKDQLKLIKDLVPTAKKVGIIYNSSEINSQVQVDVADKAAPELGLQLVKVTVTASNEVMQAAQSLVGRVDAIYLPTDNMVISSLSSVIKVAEENKIPVIAGESESVEKGALATIGIDYYQLGRTTGEMALRIIKGEKPQDMAIQGQDGTNIVLNLQAAKKMGVTVPEALQAKAKKVIK